jgi:regulatory protein
MALNLPPDLRARVEQARAEMEAERAAEAAALPATEELRAQAMTHAHRILSSRPCSGQELRDRILRAAQMTPELAIWAVEQCVEQCLIDDEAYARSFVQARIARGHGPRRIRQDLAARGIAPEIAETALTAAEQADEELHTRVCQGQLEKRYDADALADTATRAKATRWLLGRGFAHGQVESAIRAVRSAAE